MAEALVAASRWLYGSVCDVENSLEDSDRYWSLLKNGCAYFLRVLNAKVHFHKSSVVEQPAEKVRH